MAKKRVLVVEDDEGIRGGVVDALEFEGYDVRAAACGESGLELALTLELDLLLLDLVLPGKSGLDILRAIRREQPTLPVIVLTARGDESDRVQGLRLGADDYVVKPFSVRELLARVEAVLRRSPERPKPVEVLEAAEWTLDLAEREIRFREGASARLSDREAELLRYLASRPGRTISREEILRRVWHIESRGVETRTIDMHVARLREKLRQGGASDEVLVTVRGQGYRFEAAPIVGGASS